jgi:hypothetical protein
VPLSTTPRSLHRCRGAGLAALVVALACGSPGTPRGPGTSNPGAPGTAAAAPPPGPAATAHRDFPAFPASATPPPAAEVAALLARGLPERDRAAATRFLIDEILPWDLRELPGDPAAAPSPRAIARAAYDTLTSRLGEVPPDRRLARLATMACHRRGGRVTGRATALAVARYVADRGRPGSNLLVGYLAEARPFLAMPPDQLQAEADRIEADLAAFERDARGDDECVARQRLAVIHARHALGAVRSGRFDAAIGPLYVFLRNAGARPRRLEPP